MLYIYISIVVLILLLLKPRNMPIRSRIPDEWRPVMAAFHEELAT